MARRVRRILLICSSYDRFSLEEDGRIEKQISQEYAELELSNPPEIHRVETTAQALALLEAGERFDLVITMYFVGEISVFDFSTRAKAYDPEMPIVLMSSFSREVYRKFENYDTSCIDYIFRWNNSADLLIAIIKLIEDRKNAEQDILGSGVRAILFVEDSVRYISTYLPALYKIMLQQNADSIKDTLNERQQIARKRSRPKLLMANNYAKIAMLTLEKDDARTVAEMVRFNCKAFPTPTPLYYFARQPFFLDREAMKAIIAQMKASEEYKDIHECTAAINGEPYLFSIDLMSEKYARALANGAEAQEGDE